MDMQVLLLKEYYYEIYIYIITEGERGSAYGIGTYIREIVNFLREKENITLNLIQLFSDEKEFKVSKCEGYNILFFPSITWTGKNRNRYYRNVWFILNNYFSFMDRKNDEIIFHLNYIQEISLISYFKELLPDCKVLFTFHYHDWCFLLNGNYSKFKNIINKDDEDLTDQERIIFDIYKNEKAICNSVDGIICISKFTKNILINDFEISEKKIHLIHNGLKNDAVILSASEKKRLRNKLNISTKEKVIIYVGRLDTIKGIDILIESFKQVLKKSPNCRLIIVGEGDYSKYFKVVRNYWTKITFTGFLNKEDVYNLYQIADLGVVPSLYEEFGYVVIEMIMHELPLVVFSSGGIKDILDVYRKNDQIKSIDANENIDVEMVGNYIVDFLQKNDKVNYSEGFFFDIESMSRDYLDMYFKI